jgi:hypothetical protein
MFASSGEKRTNFICYGSATPGGTVALLSEKPRWPLPTVQAPTASKRELVRFRRLFRRIYVSSSHSIVKSAPGVPMVHVIPFQPKLKAGVIGIHATN